jgi:hypothetical protein
MFNKNDQAYVNDVVIALEAAQSLADRIGEETCVLKDLRVVVLRLNNEPALEVVKPKVYKRSALDRSYT